MAGDSLERQVGAQQRIEVSKSVANLLEMVTSRTAEAGIKAFGLLFRACLEIIELYRTDKEKKVQRERSRNAFTENCCVGPDARQVRVKAHEATSEPDVWSQ